MENVNCITCFRFLPGSGNDKFAGTIRTRSRFQRTNIQKHQFEGLYDQMYLGVFVAGDQRMRTIINRLGDI